MEHEEEDSFDVENFVSTPTDGGLPMSPPSPPHLPLPPGSHMIMDNSTYLAQVSAEAVKLRQAMEVPDFTCAPAEVELVKRLSTAIQVKERSFLQPVPGTAAVNGDLACTNPWELPGFACNNNGGMRGKYYITDHPALASFAATFREPNTPNGVWKKTNTSDMAIRAEDNRFVGIKRTMRFHPYTYTGDDASSGTKANWIMNIYFASNAWIKRGLVMCHVFEADDSTGYEDTPECLGCRPGACDGNHGGQAFGAPSNASFNSTHTGSRPMHHHDTERPADPTLVGSYIAKFSSILLGDPDDPDNSADTGNSSARRGVPPAADHGHSKKRKKIPDKKPTKISDVWDHFTKIFARDIDGKVLTFAACNHCCKILTGNSTGGTSHLARHTCACKFKPVAAARKAKDSGGHVNILSP